MLADLVYLHFTSPLFNQSFLLVLTLNTLYTAGGDDNHASGDDGGGGYGIMKMAVLLLMMMIMRE